MLAEMAARPASWRRRRADLGEGDALPGEYTDIGEGCPPCAKLDWSKLSSRSSMRTTASSASVEDCTRPMWRASSSRSSWSRQLCHTDAACHKEETNHVGTSSSTISPTCSKSCDTARQLRSENLRSEDSERALSLRLLKLPDFSMLRGSWPKAASSASSASRYLQVLSSSGTCSVFSETQSGASRSCPLMRLSKLSSTSRRTRQGCRIAPSLLPPRELWHAQRLETRSWLRSCRRDQCSPQLHTMPWGSWPAALGRKAESLVQLTDRSQCCRRSKSSSSAPSRAPWGLSTASFSEKASPSL
mmetsp:Transcript_20739/g.49186  ORF Transcript_20739/g.49186 Transcript_20739/m.49186 type:complete len:302 (+) Transcript_20739:412-1317(+)